MYKILLVEDENLIRSGLRKILKEMDFCIEEIYEAENGEEGINLIKSISPHIIITDIKMPKIDGLDFIEYAMRKLHCKAKFIILSCYGEFDFAQRAISYGVMEYLLKPIKVDRLYNALKKTIGRIESEDRTEAEKMRTDIKVEKLQGVVIKDIMEGLYRTEEIGKTIFDAGICFKSGGFVVTAMYTGASTGMSNEDMESCMERLHGWYYYYITEYRRVVYLINMEEIDWEKNKDSFMKSLLECPDSAGKKSCILVSLGVSSWSDSPELLPSLVRQAKKALDLRMVNPECKIFTFHEIENADVSIPNLSLYYETIYNALSTRNEPAIANAVDGLFQHLKKSADFSPEMLKTVIGNLIQLSMSSGMENRSSKKGSELDTEYIYQTSGSISELKMRLKQVLLAICKNSRELSEHSSKIESVLQYIEKKYYSDLTLDIAANLANMNSNYFSSFFKKEVGLSFTDYLQKVRVEKSKRLLAESDYKIFEVAQKVGYSDDKYFFKIFRKLSGLTPNEYRNKCRNTG